MAEAALSPTHHPTSDITGTGRLARSLQETFTVIVRIRTDRQSAQDVDSFRSHVKRLLALADEEARGFGYDRTMVKDAIYAVVAFLDEAVLNSSQPMFRDWPRRPLQEEVFGDHMAGENFFKTLSELLKRPDSWELADLLEVYQLCLVLGFRGRFGSGGDGEIYRYTSTLQERIDRIRGGHPALAPSWPLPQGETPPTSRDPWVRRLAIALVVVLILAGGAFVLYRILLGGAVDDLTAAAMAIPELAGIHDGSTRGAL